VLAREHVGPIDEDQLYYLETGHPAEEAERLIVFGFFDDVLDRLPLRDGSSAAGTVIDKMEHRSSCGEQDLLRE